MLASSLLLFLFSASALARPRHLASRSFAPADNSCVNPAFDPLDYSAKVRQAPGLCEAPNLFPRSSSDDDYSCGEHKPCSNGACCSKKTGYCNYGPDACGTNGKSPNDVCWSNCDAHAECGKDALPANKKCPLNVCCSEYGFCGTTSDFCSKPGCQSGCDQPKPHVKKGDVQKRIIGYYETWAHDRTCQDMDWQRIPVESLTHINFAFAYIAPDILDILIMPGTTGSTDPFSDFTALKSRNPALKAMMSIGGWSFNDNGTDTQPVFSDMSSSPEKRGKFITNLITFMRHYGFDGVDLDWEYPGAPDRGGNPDDGSNYTKLLQDMREAFSKEPENYELSFTAPTSYWYLRGFDITNMMKHVDYMNLMTYDLHGVWDAKNPIGNHVLAHTNLTEIDEALDLLWRNDIDPGQVNLGLGFYGRTFTLSDPKCSTPGCNFKAGGQPGGCSKNSGTLTYAEVVETLANYDVDPVYDEANAVKYVVWNKDQWASYDDKQTFQQKIKYANGKGLGGLFIWAIDQDTRNLDALQGVLYPQQLKVRPPQDPSKWDDVAGGDCFVPQCGAPCSPGSIQVWRGNNGMCDNQSICCPIASAPDPKKCVWRAQEYPGGCNGQCDGGEVAIASGTQDCGGHRFLCCEVPNIHSIACGWNDECPPDQEIMTFAGTFLEDIIPVVSGTPIDLLTGGALSEALSGLDRELGKNYCCSKEEFAKWKDCYWAGTTHKGFLDSDSCDDNHCATGGDTCAPNYTLQRAWCCLPADGKSPFLPVPLEDLFPEPPPGDPDVEFNLEQDDTWGTGEDKEPGKDDPNDAAFGFVVITSPEEVQVSLDKRDGSHWELFDCTDSESENEHSIRMVCTDTTVNSNCHKIHLGHGAPGTILEMPEGCGPGRYAVAKSMTLAMNQSMPHYLAKRGIFSEVYDLTFDYDFERVPRDMGESLMRIDYSNEPGYWDAVVDKAGETKRKRSLEDVGGNHKRWLEEEWRDDLHHGALSREDLHKRWFGSSVLSWLKNLITTGEAKVTETLHHDVDETVSIILIDEQWGPCPVGPASAQANLKAQIDTHVQVSTSFGLTIITKLAFPPDLSKSYLYFKNKGSITSKFQLDAVASISYSSGDKKLIGLDDFPGATFRIPGIVTVGPNLAVYGSMDASFTVAGHLESEVNLAKWETEQTYPQTNEYPATVPDKPDQTGTQTLGKPTFDWSVSAQGAVTLHLKPTITFGIVFDSRWKVDRCAVDLVADGYVVFHAEAQAGTGANCPFTYGIDAGADMYIQLQAPNIFGWGGTQRHRLGGVDRRQITKGGTCPAQETPLRRSISSAPFLNDNETLFFDPSVRVWDPLVDEDFLPPASALSHITVTKRDTFSVGPIISIPQEYLKCPGVTPTLAQNCSYACGVADVEPGDDGGSFGKRTLSCPVWPAPEGVCSSSTLEKREKRRAEFIHPAWLDSNDDGILLSLYPGCSTTNLPHNLPNNVPRWYLAEAQIPNGRTCSVEIAKRSLDTTPIGPNGDDGTPLATVAGYVVKYDKDQKAGFATDHVFEAHFITDFINWLVDMDQPAAENNPIPWPTGWTRPDVDWVAHYLGVSHTPFTFDWDADDNHYNYEAAGAGLDGTWIVHCGEVLGSISQRSRLALLSARMNGLKGTVTQGNIPGTRYLTEEDEVRNQVVMTAAVFSYLRQDPITEAFRGPSNDVEQICDAWDHAYRASQDDVTGTAFISPDLQRLGLRSLWNYFMDSYIDRIEQQLMRYRTLAGAALTRAASSKDRTAQDAARAFITNTIQGTAQRMMVFPRDPNAVQTQVDHALRTTSLYGLWGRSGLGATGL